MPNALLDKEPGYFYGSILSLRQKQDASGVRSGPMEWAVPELLREPANAMLSVGKAYRGELADPVGEAAKAAMSFTGGGLALGKAPANALGMSIRGYHGTPHKFEPVEHNPFGEFRDQAIGTGEGEQVYGHGHYVAGQKATAEYYKEALADNGFRAKHDIELYPQFQIKQGERVGDDSIPTWLYRQLIAEGAEPDFAHEAAFAALHPNTARGKQLAGGAWEPRAREILDKNFEQVNDGALLEVLIRPDEQELLSWDLPLSRQSKAVQDKLRPIIESFAQGDKEARERLIAQYPETARALAREANVEEMWNLTGGTVLQAA